MIEPYYSDDLVTLYCADALDILGEFSAECCLTDCPNEVGREWLGDLHTRQLHVMVQVGDILDWIPSMGEWGRYESMTIWQRMVPTMAGFGWDAMLHYGDDPRITRIIDTEARYTTHSAERGLQSWRYMLGSSGWPKSVIDPFAGSGTTLVAAKLCNIKAIGIEINPSYCDMIVERLRG